jgi:bifunctional DNA-binding transcriptional regulator/antitoxin component of YhaV-PrlF toxin-antitoxin module
MATQAKQPKKGSRALVKIVRGFQITLPTDMRKVLGVEEGGYLEAEVQHGIIQLRPVKLVSPTEAERRLDDILGRIQYTGPEPAPSEEDIMAEVVDIIHQSRRENAQGGAR